MVMNKNATHATKSCPKKKSNKKDVKINVKNYFYAFIILFGSILLVVYIFSWYNVKKTEKLMTSYLVKSGTVESVISDLDSLNQLRQESPSSYFIYLSYTNDEYVYNFEKELKRVIDKYSINDIFYYVDLTSLKDKNEDYIKEINSKLNISALNDLPAIIYVRDGKILESNILDGIGSTKLKIEDFEHLLEIYEFEI